MKRGTGTTRAAIRRCALAVTALGLMLALPAVAQAAPLRIVIDPGHGGKDPGAVGGAVEKRTNLAISKAVSVEAKRQGWQVRLTRRGDQFVGLTTRPAVATAFKADVFVSIHSNSSGRAPKGNMTIYRTPAGRRLGQSIMNEISKLTPYKDIGNKRDVRGLAVLRAAKKPAVLVELLSVTSASEARQLRDPEMQKRYAEAIVRGIAMDRGVAYKQEPVAGEPQQIPGAPAGSPPAAAASAPATAAPVTTSIPATSASVTDAPYDLAPRDPAPSTVATASASGAGTTVQAIGRLLLDLIR